MEHKWDQFDMCAHSLIPSPLYVYQPLLFILLHAQIASVWFIIVDWDLHLVNNITYLIVCIITLHCTFRLLIKQGLKFKHLNHVSSSTLRHSLYMFMCVGVCVSVCECVCRFKPNKKIKTSDAIYKIKVLYTYVIIILITFITNSVKSVNLVYRSRKKIKIK